MTLVLGSDRFGRRRATGWRSDVRRWQLVHRRFVSTAILLLLVAGPEFATGDEVRFPGTPDELWPRGLPVVGHAGDGYFLFVRVKGRIASDRLTLTGDNLWMR